MNMLFYCDTHLKLVKLTHISGGTRCEVPFQTRASYWVFRCFLSASMIKFFSKIMRFGRNNWTKDQSMCIVGKSLICPFSQLDNTLLETSVKRRGKIMAWVIWVLQRWERRGGNVYFGSAISHQDSPSSNRLWWRESLLCYDRRDVMLRGWY
jgi:hypothetical protein